MAELTQLGAKKPDAPMPDSEGAAGPRPAAASQAAPQKQVHVTPKAVEHIRQAFAREGVSGGLRLGVLGGGCSGLSYQFKFAPQPKPRDYIFEFDDVKVFVDPKSMVFLDGMTLDWKDSLMQSGFVFENPHATRSCGCGSSFSA